jgi:hypothetical protein
MRVPERADESQRIDVASHSRKARCHDGRIGIVNARDRDARPSFLVEWSRVDGRVERGARATGRDANPPERIAASKRQHGERLRAARSDCEEDRHTPHAETAVVTARVLRARKGGSIDCTRERHERGLADTHRWVVDGVPHVRQELSCPIAVQPEKRCGAHIGIVVPRKRVAEGEEIARCGGSKPRDSGATCAASVRRAAHGIGFPVKGLFRRRRSCFGRIVMGCFVNGLILWRG